MPMTNPIRVVLKHSLADGSARWLDFSEPVDVVSTRLHSEVLPSLQRIEQAVQKGLYAAGFVAYEAAPAFDSALRVNPQGSLPLLWFGLYEKIQDPGDEPNLACAIPSWQPSVTSTNTATPSPASRS